MIKRKYPDIVREAGQQYCSGVNARGFVCHAFDHRTGEAEPGVVHMLDGKWSWPRAYRLLKLIALARHPDINDEPTWRRVYRLSTTANEIGRAMHMRVPFRFTTFDRRFVLAALADVPNAVPDRQRAFNWARKVKKES